MNKISRRNFIRNSSFSAGVTLVASQLPFNLFANEPLLNIPVGFQTWSVKDDLAKDFTGTMKKIAAQGYKLMEMCSPKGYVNAGFAPLAEMKTSDMRKAISDSGLSCPSCHFGLSELTDNLDDRIEFAKELGLIEMICSSFGLPKTASLDDYLAAADKLNIAGEKIRNAGLQAGFHNHSIEFAKLDGKLIYDELLKRFDPGLVKLQFQTEVINLGYRASDYFKKYPGRFVSAHLSDWSSDKKEMPVGKGIIEWKEFFAAAKTAGVKHFFVEMSPSTFKDSIAYIKHL